MMNLTEGHLLETIKNDRGMWKSSALKVDAAWYLPAPSPYPVQPCIRKVLTKALIPNSTDKNDFRITVSTSSLHTWLMMTSQYLPHLFTFGYPTMAPIQTVRRKIMTF